jgi:hypothetical protein
MAISVQALIAAEEEKKAKMSPKELANYEAENQRKLKETLESFRKTWGFQSQAFSWIHELPESMSGIRKISGLLDGFRSLGHHLDLTAQLSKAMDITPNRALEGFTIPVIRDHKAEALFKIERDTKEQLLAIQTQNRALTSLDSKAGVQNELVSELLLELERYAADQHCKYLEERRNRILMTWVALGGLVVGLFGVAVAFLK